MQNPVLYTDLPDPDVIRVGDTYYMVCTTKHFMPGGLILRSFDLIHWEICSYLFDKLESTPGECMIGEQSIYGYGMEAGCIRYHEGKYYVTFYPHGKDYTYLFVADSPEGPWEKRKYDSVYYFNSLLFDDDGKVYMVFGYRSIYLMEMKKDLSGPQPGGIYKELLKDSSDAYVNYNGAHFYKINGKYYLFLMKWPKEGNAMRTQYCFVADKVDGEYSGGEVLCTDYGFYHQGVAQCALVDTPDGEWYAMLYQDRGVIGRVPVLAPVSFQNGMPVFGKAGKLTDHFSVPDLRPGYSYEPLYCSDEFVRTSRQERQCGIYHQWQWNHEPDHKLWWMGERGGLYIKTGKISSNLIQARNTLTQRCVGPTSEVMVTVRADGLKEGDYAGLCILQGCYGFIGVTKELNRYYLVVISRELKESPMGEVFPDYMPGTMQEKLLLQGSEVTLKIEADFTDMNDTARFSYWTNHRFEQVGKEHRLYFKIDHFAGARYGLTVYATKEVGGVACFRNFEYNV